MALRRRGDRTGSSVIWPGFVDAMTALLLVLMFVLSIFMIVQYVLREELVGKDRSLQNLTVQLGELTSQLSLAEQENDFYQAELESLTGLLDEERTRAEELAEALKSEEDARERLSREVAEQVLEIAALTSSLEETQSAENDLQLLVAALTDERDAAQAELASINDRADNLAATEAQNAALRESVDTLEQQRDDAVAALSTARAALSDAEREAAERDATLEVIRAQLAEAREATRQSELTLGEKIAALELALDRRREEAEETLLLLAAAEAKRDDLQLNLSEAQSETDNARDQIDRLRQLLAQVSAEADDAVAEATETASQNELAAAFARAALQDEREVSAEARQAIALLNTQVRQLRNEISGLRLQLDEADARDVESQVVIQDLGQRLNKALAQKVDELQRYRSEFFGRVREALGARDDIRVVGDRFVFQSEVLFGTGEAQLGPGGRAQLSRLAAIIRDIQDDIPEDIDWVLRVDGHTDRVPIFGGRYRDNWELSQARALSVVRYLIQNEEIPADRLAAAGFGEFQPIDPANNPQAYARNRRIEMRLTER